MANMYDISAGIQQPNIVGNFNQGVQTAQQNQVFGEKQQAYQQALQDQQNLRSLAPQVQAGDPNAFSQAAAIDPAAAQAQQGAGDAQFRRLQGALNYIDQQKTPQAKEVAYQQTRPFFASNGKTPPSTYAEAQPILDQVKAHIAMLGPSKLMSIGAGGSVFDTGTRTAIYTNTGVPKTPPIVSVNMPDGSTQQYQHNPDGTLSPLRMAPQGAPQGASQGVPDVQLTPNPNAPSVAADQATALVSSGADPGVAAARAMAMHPGTTLAYDPASKTFKDVSDGSAQIGAGGGSAPAQAGISAPDTGQLGRSAPKGSEQKAPTGYQYNADRTALIPIPGGPADKGQAGAALGDPTLTGEDYLNSIGDPAMESMVKAVAEGRMPLPKIYRSGKAGEIGPTQIAQAVAQYDPTYDQADPTSRIKARNDFTSGKSAVQLRQLNTLLGHIGGLSDAADKLDNTGNTLINSAENAIGSTYNTKVSNFDAAARPAAEEFAALLKGGVPSVEEIKAAHEMLSPNKTPAQLHGVIGTMAAQIQSRIAALQAQAKNSLGPFANKVTIITPEGQAALDKLRNKGLIGKFDLGEEGTNPAASSASPAPPTQGGWSIQRVQ